MTDGLGGPPAEPTGDDNPEAPPPETAEEPVAGEPEPSETAAPEPETAAPEPARPAAAKEKPAAAPAAAAPAAAAEKLEAAGSGGAPKKPGITLGALKPSRTGPRAVAMRVGIILAAVLILAAVVVGGITAVGHLGGKGANVATGTSPSPSPSPSPGAETYYTYNNAGDQYSVDRPSDWTERVLDKNVQPAANGTCFSPCISLVIGPPEPYPNGDYIAILIAPMGQVYGQNDLNSFKSLIQQNYITSNANIIGEGLTASRNLPGWNFIWTAPGVSPTVTSDAYFLMDGDHMVIIQLQIQPPGDTQSFSALQPVLMDMARSYTSYYPIPSAAPATSTASPAPTSTASP
ncbi:MAG TPA: hypothetical protein VHA57_09410 [Actinomycetota bacterium]|nr:hypothetical protein [Actinomycetota bacterium]